MDDSFATEPHLSCHFLYFAFLTFCVHYSCAKWRKKCLFTLGGTIWFEFSHKEEENGSPVEKELRVPGWKRSVHAKPPHRPHHITQTQLAQGRGSWRAPHSRSRQPGSGKQSSTSAIWCAFIKHCSEWFRSTGYLLKALADVQVLLLLPELRESKPLLKQNATKLTKNLEATLKAFVFPFWK